jgi:dipeptidyl aminopeptidase/acylaminoacyl peptidase
MTCTFTRRCLNSTTVAARGDVAAVVQSVERDKDAYASNMWICPLDARPARQLTQGGDLDSSPRWSPQGDRIAFVPTREDGERQLCLIDSMGSRPRRAVRLLRASRPVAGCLKATACC